MDGGGVGKLNLSFLIYVDGILSSDLRISTQ